METITININKEINYAYDELAEFLVSEGGTIFGGYIRDKIYRKNNKNGKNGKSGGFAFIEEIIPSDIDVFFDYKESLKTINDYLKSNGYGYSYKKKTKNFYLQNVQVNHYSYEIIKMICNLHNKVKTIELKLDVLIGDNTGLLPPFERLDFITNCLIMDSSGISISPCTGTYMDNIEHFEKLDLLCDIINFIKNKQTYIMKSGKEIIKKLNRSLKLIENDWNIINIPFIKQCYGEECVVCSSGCEFVLCTGTFMCKTCLEKYMTTEVKKEIEEEKEIDEIIFKDPYRNECRIKLF
jgi:hypothetical protein